MVRYRTEYRTDDVLEKEQLNTVVSGRYFAGMWKCFLYPLGLLILVALLAATGRAVAFFIVLIGVAMASIVAFFGTVWCLHADAINLKETHGLSKRAWPYWIAFMFIGYWSVLIYYWTRSRLIKRAGLTEESLTWGDRILHYMYRNNIPSQQHS